MSQSLDTLTERERIAQLWAELTAAVVEAAPRMSPAQLDRIKALLGPAKNGDAR